MSLINPTELQEQLTDLAEALGARVPSQKAVKVWIDALDGFEHEDIMLALTDWPKFHVKMPAPADIRKACSERLSARIEAESRKNNAEVKYIEDDVPQSPIAAAAAVLRMQELKRCFTVSRDHLWHARLLMKLVNGEPLCAAQMDRLVDVYGKDISQKDVDAARAMCEKAEIQLMSVPSYYQCKQSLMRNPRLVNDLLAPKVRLNLETFR